MKILLKFKNIICWELKHSTLMHTMDIFKLLRLILSYVAHFYYEPIHTFLRLVGIDSKMIKTIIIHPV